MIVPDFVSVDHRQLGFGTRDVSEWLASSGPLLDADAGVELICRQIHRATDEVTLRSVAFGDASASYEMLGVVVFDSSDRQVRSELFDLDQWELANRRFDELTAGGSVPQPDRSLRNRATVAFFERLPAATKADDVTAALQRVLHPDLVYEVNRRSVHGPSGGRKAMIEGSHSWFEVGFRPVAAPVELRGDHLALVGMNWTTEDGDDELGMWLVVEADDEHRITYFGVWDDDDLDAARAEVDRRTRQ